MRAKGIGIGLAAAVKLTPLIFIAYLLLTRRVRAAAVSALTFAATIGLGFALLPHASAVYWGGQFGSRAALRSICSTSPSTAPSCGSPTPGTRRTRTGWPRRSSPPSWASERRWWPAAACHELLGLVTCAATSLLVSPVSWSHHYVYVIPALYRCARPRRLGYRIAGVALIVGLFGFWPVPIGADGGYDPRARPLPRALLRLAPNRGHNLEFTWRGLELIAGNYYVVMLLVLVAATAGAMVVTRRRWRAADEPTAAPSAARMTKVTKELSGDARRSRGAGPAHWVGWVRGLCIPERLQRDGGPIVPWWYPDPSMYPQLVLSVFCVR